MFEKKNTDVKEETLLKRGQLSTDGYRRSFFVVAGGESKGRIRSWRPMLSPVGTDQVKRFRWKESLPKTGRRRGEEMTCIVPLVSPQMQSFHHRVTNGGVIPNNDFIRTSIILSFVANRIQSSFLLRNVMDCADRLVLTLTIRTIRNDRCHREAKFSAQRSSPKWDPRKALPRRSF